MSLVNLKTTLISQKNILTPLCVSYIYLEALTSVSDIKILPYRLLLFKIEMFGVMLTSLHRGALTDLTGIGIHVTEKCVQQKNRK